MITLKPTDWPFTVCPSFSPRSSLHSTHLQNKSPSRSGCENPTTSHSSSSWFSYSAHSLHSCVLPFLSHFIHFLSHHILPLSSTQKCAYLMQHEPHRSVPMSVMTHTEPGPKGQQGETWRLMVNLIIGVSRVRANSTNIVHAITDMRKEFRGREREEEGQTCHKKGKKKKMIFFFLKKKKRSVRKWKEKWGQREKLYMRRKKRWTMSRQKRKETWEENKKRRLPWTHRVLVPQQHNTIWCHEMKGVWQKVIKVQEDSATQQLLSFTAHNSLNSPRM